MTIDGARSKLKREAVGNPVCADVPLRILTDVSGLHHMT
jgi:hypothetical protein